MLNRIIKWLSASHRWLHLIGGVAVGGACAAATALAHGGPTAAVIAGAAGAVVSACTLEFKDYQHGCLPDIIDWALTAGPWLITAIIVCLC